MLRRQRERLAYGLILPSMALITGLSLYPVIEAIVVSLQRQNLMRPDPTGFVGLANYAAVLFDDDAFWSSFGHTIIFTAGSVAGGYLLGLALALLLSLDVRGRTFFRALFLIPWVIPDVAVAMLWKWLYGDEFGIINFLGLKSGLIEQPVQWLADTQIAMPALILVQTWKLYPVMFVVLLAALQNVSKDLHEAAKLDGATSLQRLWHITLPLIRPASVVITLLSAIWTFQSFDVIYLLTGGGPASATKVLSILVYEKAFGALNRGDATALAILMMAGLLMLTLGYLAAYRSQRDA